MRLALIVYAIAERKLREAVERRGDDHGSKGKPTNKPTILRAFQVFKGITVLYNGTMMIKVLNLRPIHLKILPLLGRD